MSSVPPPNAYKPGTVLTVGSHTAIIVKYISEGVPKYADSKIACLKRVAVPDKVSLNILRAEVDSMQRVKGHRHIVSYIDSHAARMPTGTGYEVFVLMEYCANKGLIDFMNTRLQNRLREDEVLRIMGEITEGVANMHALDPSLIHRDIKIENVLISENGDYKLCDFGSASPVLRPPRDADEFAILQNDVLRNTTAQYRAPEMIDLYRGLPIDEKSDIWALGIFLYKLCYYTTPFEEKGETAILQSQFTFPRYPHYSDRLRNLISVLLRTDPRRRPNAYQTLEEVCKMRSVSVPIEDYTKKKHTSAATFKPKVHATKVPLPQAQSQGKTENFSSQPQIQLPSTANSNKPQFVKDFKHSASSGDLSNLPRSAVSTTQLQPSNNLRPLKDLNSRPVSSSLESAGNSKDPFADLDTSNFLKAKSSSPQPPPKPSRPTSSSANIYSTSHSTSEVNINKLSSSVGNLNVNDKPKSSIPPPVPTKPKYVDSIVQTDDEPLVTKSKTEDFKKPALPRRISHKRPQSMYSLPSQGQVSQQKQLYETSNQSQNDVNELKKIITGLSSQSNTVELSPGDHHINSNVDFLKTLDKQDSGKPWASAQHTGESVKSLRRISTGSKRVNSLIGTFTGKLSRSHSRSQSRNSSRASSIHESAGVYSSNTGNSHKFRSSSESIEEEIIKPAERKSIGRSNSIQRRVQALLNRNNDPPIIKTAKGYGNDSSNHTGSNNNNNNNHNGSSNNDSIGFDGFKKPTIIKRKPPVPAKKLGPKTPPLSAQSTPSTVTKTPKGSIKAVEQESPSTLKKSAPPPKPKKPTHLQTLAVSEDNDKDTLEVPSAKKHLRNNSISSEISIPDIDDLEEDFNRRYPSAV
ncbi:putative serine/threonine-protein kinase KCC4 [Wickerhamomyces ciferrii]|uniref:non-specific serine/threonine protein kinase n=1 Tax=Wickerhamomyces ciferrii (strain ATCC 14091 / BCRC 22168 / CBS 111 / JCM 3599 / NBRC 0793 / NRRL Y-1031 F-60-10) TaxID=1206466 RepID=K0KN63_WICCF|nr:putative serine/threonine-protein kinase KCC4 [Wickerhamomyces ciferrii]CCH43642.1 putative serine/threonine-protein kinase KCC4 [Wickerhamomyces ciferrii]